MTHVSPNSAYAWLLAARPKTLVAALIPVVTASALAANRHDFRLWPALLCILFATFMQIAANFINDLFDFLKGTDRADRLGPERACAQGWITPQAMRSGIGITIALAVAAGVSLLPFGGWPLIFIGAGCIIFAFLYTTLLSYCGLGDLLVWVFFGFVPVTGTYYVQAGTLCPEIWWISAACGLVTDTLLVLNNYRDRDTDRHAGKRTIVAIFGETFGRYFYLWQGIAGCACTIALLSYGHRAAALLPLFYLMPHIATWRTMSRIRQGRALNRVLGLTARNMLIFAVLMTIGFCMDTWTAV